MLADKNREYWVKVILSGDLNLEESYMNTFPPDTTYGKTREEMQCALIAVLGDRDVILKYRGSMSMILK